MLSDSTNIHSPSATLASHANLKAALSRRSFLRGLGALGAVSLVTNASCGYYAAEEGDAFSPWNFPEDETRPEYIAVGAAILASSPHNTQPWLFEVSPQRIEVYADLSKGLGAMDSEHREMYIGLGCAIENLVIAAAAHGRVAAVTLMPDAADETHVASIDLATAPPSISPLYEFITRRHTNRGRYLNEPPPAGLREALLAQVRVSEVEMAFLGHDSEKKRFSEETVRATEAIVDDTAMNEASHRWFRHSQENIAEHRDGLVYDATVANATFRSFAKLSAAYSAEKAGEVWIEMTSKIHSSASAFCILSTPDRDNREEQLLCGRSYQHLQLWAASQGLVFHPLNQMAERHDREVELELAPDFSKVLAELMGTNERGAQMLFRVGVPWDQAHASPRRPTDWVIR